MLENIQRNWHGWKVKEKTIGVVCAQDEHTDAVMRYRTGEPR